MTLFRIDVIDKARGDICEHLTWDGKRTRCGIPIVNHQTSGRREMDRNRPCGRCARIFESTYRPLRVTVAVPPWTAEPTPHMYNPSTKGGGLAPQGKANTFPIGARVLVDGRNEAIVKQAFPKGSSSFLFPHYKVDIVDGDRNVAIHMHRISVERKG